VLLLAGTVQLLRPLFREPEWTPATRAKLARLGALDPEAADGAVFGEAERAGFGILKCPGIWVGLGDPAGDTKDAISAIWRFRDLCERAGVEAAFWGIGPRYLRYYADIGLQPVPLAADGTDKAVHLAMQAERDPESIRPLVPEGLRGGA